MNNDVAQKWFQHLSPFDLRKCASRAVARNSAKVFFRRPKDNFHQPYGLAAVKKVVEQVLWFVQIARDSVIQDTQIHNWKKVFEADGTLQTEVNENHSVDAEPKRYPEKNRQLKIERAILKKTTAFFKKETGYGFC